MEDKNQLAQTQLTQVSNPHLGPASAPPATAPAPETIKDRILREAIYARDSVFPVHLAAVISGGRISLDAIKVMVNDFMTSATDSMEPVENLLLQGMLIAHYRVIQEHDLAQQTKTPEGVALHNAAACRLMDAIGRTALSLKGLRHAPAANSFQVVKQQNLVANGDQTVTYVSSAQGESLTARDEVTDKFPDAVERRLNGNGNLKQESKAGGGGTSEWPAAASTVR